MGPFFKLDKTSLLSPQMSLLVHPESCRPRSSILKRLGCSLTVSARGSSTCSMIWKGSTTLQTSLVFPFQTSSTSRLSSNNRNRYFSGKALSASRKRMIFCCSAGVRRGMGQPRAHWVKVGRNKSCGGQSTNTVKEHSRCAAIVLVVIENALPNVGIAAHNPAMKPLDRCRTRRVRVPPLEPQILGKRLDREIPRRPFRRLEYHVEIKIDGVGRREQGLHVAL